MFNRLRAKFNRWMENRDPFIREMNESGFFDYHDVVCYNEEIAHIIVKAFENRKEKVRVRVEIPGVFELEGDTFDVVEGR